MLEWIQYGWNLSLGLCMVNGMRVQSTRTSLATSWAIEEVDGEVDVDCEQIASTGCALCPHTRGRN